MDEAEYLEKAKSIILEKARPEKIVLFGSRARGGHVQDSDFDLLIIVKDGANTNGLEKDIRIALISPLVSFDILVYTETEYEAAHREGWILMKEIDRDGKLIYAA